MSGKLAQQLPRGSNEATEHFIKHVFPQNTLRYCEHPVPSGGQNKHFQEAVIVEVYSLYSRMSHVL